MVQRRRNKTIPLIVEAHPVGYDGYPFITLLQYRQQHILTIIDNVDRKTIKAYVLDDCGPTNVNEELVISVAVEWYTKSKDHYPLSFEFSRMGLTDEVSPIYKKFNIDFVSRLIGPTTTFDMANVLSTKRRRRKELPAGMVVVKNIKC